MIVVWLIVDEAHVATLATHPDHRRQGIGRRLLAHVLRHMLQDGARSSFLEVRESNLAAQEMYRKFGYEVKGRRRHYYRDNDEDAILMNLDSLNAELLSLDDEHSTLDRDPQNER
jgi:ribosomal-protein-alanine N-acetyltransferase